MKSIPIIDLNDNNAADKLYDALSTIGFAAINNNGIIDKSSLDIAYHDAKFFFSLSERNKKQLHRPDLDCQRGYTPFMTEKAKDQTVPDLKEFIQFGHEDNVYYDDDQIHAYDTLFCKFNLLAQKIMSMIAPKIGMTKEVLSRTQYGSTILRVIHYPPTGPNPEGWRSAPHEDINLITLLPAASASGLQVKNSNGDWIDAPTDPNLIIVNVGDMLDEWSGSKLKSTTHRVVNTKEGEDNSRYSMPLFYHPPADFVLSDRYTAGQYLDQRLREIGLKK